MFEAPLPLCFESATNSVYVVLGVLQSSTSPYC
nr:MAG TPA: hypothetical protein [Caudoviricetes sp.]